ncbi:DUF6880 family protein [Celeribacter sp.]|uniref:DUF6880 family protein n=1 Tax=Celeribacter sp. TaxID=1890673 RepID=UPI003A8CC4DE
MARKPSLSIEKLTELPAQKLAQLVLDEAERNVGFRRQVKAALAAKSGPEGIAKLIDRRLSGLERAKSFIDWDKARAFRDDLQSLTDTIEAELAPAAPDMAMDRFIRFIATHERVFERVDDSSGHVQDVYYLAIISAGKLTAQLSASEAALLPDKIMARLDETTHGYLADLTKAIAPHLPQSTLARWDAELDAAFAQRKLEEAKLSTDRWHYSMTSQWSKMRQTIAEACGDIDLMITLESGKKPHMQDVQGMAGRLLAAGRADEALEWVRKPGSRVKGQDDALSPNRVQIEASILEALGDKSAAQALRWQCFESRLSADILHDYLKNLPDFYDIEPETSALQYGLSHQVPELALRFYLDWPRLDLAAQVILQHHAHWGGGLWHSLPKTAETLEHEHPAAATILYRALLDDILKAARTKAYGHGARYLGKLALLAEAADPFLPEGVMAHEAYMAELRKNHGRKSGFWGRVG